MKKKFSLVSSALLVAAAALLFLSANFPWWGMNFIAPQYPEGLDIIVYPDKLEGDIDNINALNHYIGMAQFSEENFPELSYVKYLIWGLAGITLLTAILRKRVILYSLIAVFVVGGILGVYDLNRWLKDFGTNLNPNAPITIDPFIPPMIGENQLANFITNSYLDNGTYLVLAAFVLILIPLWKDRKTS
ncbi:hypothetical protein AM500_23190 [Bacillus sp. FJAT-18017]|uniref:hypothetical protein n=1 Tax=Bacillus sp. FJAT-18017 TaxID=1705566 RepID=UPI0006B04849|nr:hypothetical protein [Bacillus sp. FJAT-18017]ALC92351.1 hypothetical protein AM500_23190 [Bacillus sp. FJAT-18017]